MTFKRVGAFKGNLFTFNILSADPSLYAPEGTHSLLVCHKYLKYLLEHAMNTVSLDHWTPDYVSLFIVQGMRAW